MRALLYIPFKGLYEARIPSFPTKSQPEKVTVLRASQKKAKGFWELPWNNIA